MIHIMKDCSARKKNAKHAIFCLLFKSCCGSPWYQSCKGRETPVHLLIYSVQSQNQVSTAVFAFCLIFRLSWQKIKKVKWFARDHTMSQNLEPRLTQDGLWLQCTGFAYSVNHTSSSCFPSSYEQNMRKFVENLSKAENHPAAGCL